MGVILQGKMAAIWKVHPTIIKLSRVAAEGMFKETRKLLEARK